ncbi:MAG: DUF4271 domain-containing protein [Tannerella sp.]|jgi:hypothetical protein|nr:DUF4271 domain-containing protein [Tannerella sp.]
MGTNILEGYIGIRTGDEQFVYDTLFVLILLLLVSFGFVFRYHYSLFIKMLNDLFSMKERQNLFDAPVKKNLFFTGFLQFQTLFLCALFFFLVYSNYTGTQNPDFLAAGLMIAVFLCVIIVFYLLKQCLYALYGRVFGENGQYRFWSTKYHGLASLWGISLYLPVLWLTFDHTHLTEGLIFFAISYLIPRITLIYMTFRIFYNKNTGLLYLSSYLCAQEIIPLLFLYKGLIYLYNTIEASTLWH